MPDVDLEMPDLDDIDHDAGTFRRVLAIVVVLLTLFGATVAYLQSDASNHEDNNAREAARASINGLGTEVQAATEYRYNYQAWVQAKLLQQRQQIDASLGKAVPAGDPLASLYTESAARWADLAAKLDTDTPLLTDPQFGEKTDPQFPGAFDAQLEIQPTAQRLSHEVLATESNDHGNKADSYVAVLTLLAAALFLAGLSLTVAGRGRYYLVGAAAILTVVSVGATLIVTIRPVHHVTADSVQLAAEGSALTAQGHYDQAIDKLDAAIDQSPRFAGAFSLRSEAEFASGSDQSNAGFVSIVEPGALDRSTRDLEKAVALGDDNDVGVVGNLGFQYFLEKKFSQASSFTQKAIALNDNDPALWFNLGVIELARGNDTAATNAYANGLTTLDQVDPTTRPEVISGALVDLGLLVQFVPDRADRAQEVKGKLARYDAQQNHDLASSVPDSAGGATATSFDLAVNGNFVSATYGIVGLDKGTTVDNIWYYRADGNQPFDQPLGMREVEAATDPSSMASTVSNGACLPAGEYRVEVYAGTSMIGSDSFQVPQHALGTIVSDDEPAQGFTMCRPSNWQSSFDETNASVMFASNDDTVVVGVQVTPSSTELRSGNPDQIMTQTIQQVITAQGGTLDRVDDETLNGNTADGNYVALAAKTGFGTISGNSVTITASLGPDGVLRTVAILAPDPKTIGLVRDEVLPTLTFVRVVSPPRGPA